MTSPRGLKKALASFEGFHRYDPKNVAKLPSTVRIPSHVYVPGPCKYVTYRSDKWNDGSYDYIHDIDSYPRVKLGIIGKRNGRKTKVPKRISDNATLIMIRTRALGFGYTNNDNETVDCTVSRCSWFWHPTGRALLLIEDKRRLAAIVWGGDLGFEDRGIVG